MHKKIKYIVKFENEKKIKYKNLIKKIINVILGNVNKIRITKLGAPS